MGAYFAGLLLAAHALSAAGQPAPAPGDPFVAAALELFAAWDATALTESAAAAADKEKGHLASGLTAFLSGDYATALRLGNAAARSELPDLQAAGEGLADLSASWQTVFSGLKPFPAPAAGVSAGQAAAVQVFYPASLPAPDAALLAHARLVAAECTGWLAAEGDKALPVVVFLAAVSDLATVSRIPVARLEATGTVATTVWGRILLLSPASFPDGYPWDRVLCHEAVHFTLHTRVRSGLPLFLEEGLAAYLEDVGPTGAPHVAGPADAALASLAAGQSLLLSQTDLDSPYYNLDSPVAARIAFLQVRFLVSQLVKQGGDAALRNLVDAVAQGIQWRAAVAGVAGFSEAGVTSWLKGRPRDEAPRSDVLLMTAAVAPDRLPEKSARSLEPARRDVLLADLLWGRGKLSAALGILSRLPDELRLTPDTTWRIAMLLLTLQRPAEADAALAAPLALFPDDARLLYCAARARLALGDRGQAGQLARRAWLVNPFAKETIELLGRTHD
jgi:tetratricopeptide (TPR) repeat protein